MSVARRQKIIFNFFPTFLIAIVSLIEFRTSTGFGMIHVNSHKKTIYYTKARRASPKARLNL